MRTLFEGWGGITLAILLAVGLGACAITPADLEPLTPTERVYVLKQDFDKKLDVVLRYAKQPPCSAVRVVACSDQEVVKALYILTTNVDTALDLAGLNLDTAGLGVARTAYTTLVNELLRRQLIEVAQ